ncbi:oxidoreductase [Nocardia sp. NPDC051787]|uniref:oxidoreductase n=1 Tax=Nocardia sp. NPDC051787 TaxID=3155415 RepID=UPI00342B44BA
MRRRTTTPDWTCADVPDLRGRTAVVTGANSGLGFETARILAERGAAVVLACRTVDKAVAATVRIRETAPTAELHVVRLDLMSLAAVREAAEKIRANHDRIDLLINNAGTTQVQRVRTVDGFEATFATNHLGPFAFTGLLFDRLAAVPGARIVTVSSATHRYGAIAFGDLHFERRKYHYMFAYIQSKLANLLFTFELQRRLTAAGSRVVSVAAHPGVAKTQWAHRATAGVRILVTAPPLQPLISLVQQPAAAGALAIVRAAVDPQVAGGEFYGPSGLFGLKGYPVLTEPARQALDVRTQQRLWRESERLTGIEYPNGIQH